MSAILSADDLNDFISPGVACIKPVETLPKQAPEEVNAYEVTTEDKLQKANAPPAQISLTDCLACSGCVTSAEAVLVSLQSHSEVLNALDSQPSIHLSATGYEDEANTAQGRLFVASVSPQVRASLAATYGVSEAEAGWMIDQLLGGPQGLATGGKYGNGFSWIIDTNAMREASLVLGADEVTESLQNTAPQATSNDDGASTTSPKRPILSSACPGWICYAEKTHPHVLPHLSRLKSPQALTGTLLKTILSQRLNIRPDQIWHVSIMPCFDKKLEASREELTDIYWRPPSTTAAAQPVRDVDCVITAREVLMLADTRGISFPALPRTPIHSSAFPDPMLSSFLFPKHHRKQTSEAGTSGGYLHHILQTQLALAPSSVLKTTRGRNADVVEYAITSPDQEQPVFKAARYYGFRNIQNLVRKLKPQKKSRLPGGRVGAKAAAAKGGGAGMDYAYVEVMACPGGCTNGGGQIKVDDLPIKPETAMSQKEWLGRVDEAYYSMSDSESENENENNDAMKINDIGYEEAREVEGEDVINGIDTAHVREVLEHWAQTTGIGLQKLVTTSYRKVESDVGKVGGAENERVVELAGKIGGGW
ncbi:MAG: Cytosolic Fe-S cluster assembly factor nar1 [Alectoria sarmentosa]|nr:MAG: Cytosolic Fe-S cluster assembly factor nar1 [Alectoria sarmentosa]